MSKKELIQKVIRVVVKDVFPYMTNINNDSDEWIFVVYEMH